MEFVKYIIAAIGLVGIAAFAPCALADDSYTGPQPGLKPLDPQGHMQISSQDRCPVCAMWVARYKKFAAAIQVKDGRTFYFCSCGCMIRSWMHPEIFLATTPEALERTVVQDYFSGDQVDGRSVSWVVGSDVIGPMGPAVVPVSEARHLAVFKRRHGARAVFRLSELTDEKWQQMTGHQAVSE